MVYKLGNVSDMDRLPPMDPKLWNVLFEYTSVLSNEYGEDRNVDSDDGGYVLYVMPGTPVEEIKAYFDYSAATIEYVDMFPWTSPPTCGGMYLLHNEFAVVVVVPIAEAPLEISNMFEERN